MNNKIDLTWKTIVMIVMVALSSISYSFQDKDTYNIKSNYKVMTNGIEILGTPNVVALKTIIKEKYKLLGYADVGVVVNGDNIEILDDKWLIEQVIILGVDESEKPELLQMVGMGGWLLSEVNYIEGFSLLDGLKKIKEHYINNGYPDIEIDYDVIENSLEISIRKGVKVKILSVNIRSDLINTELFDKINQLLEKESDHSDFKIQSAVEIAKTYLDNNGYASGKISVNINRISKKYEIINIEIFGNGVKFINNVKLDGWELEKEYQFKFIKKGEVYKVKNLKSEIRSLQFTQLYKEIKYFVESDGADINIRILLTPNKTTTIYGGAEIQNERSMVILRLTQKNFLNKGIKFINSVSVGSGEGLYSSSVTLEDDINIRYSYKVFDMDGDLKGTRQQLTYQKNNTLENKYFQVFGISEGCDICVTSHGIGVGAGKTWKYINNVLDPNDGNITKIAGDVIFKSQSIGVIGDAHHTLFSNDFKPIYIKNNLLIGFGYNESYIARNRNKASIRGYTPSSFNQYDNIIIKNSTDLYTIKSIYDSKIKFGAYLDLYDEKKNRNNQEITYGLSASILTSHGNIEIYKGLYSRRGNEAKVGLNFNQKF